MICLVFLNIPPAVGRRMDCSRQRTRPASTLWHQSRVKVMVGAVEETQSDKIRMILSREMKKDPDWTWE